MTELLAAAGEGLALVFSWPNILYPVLGTLAAMVVSFLPGIGTATLMALALPLTLRWEPVEVMLLFGALVGGATFMGSVTAILFNVPGSAPSAATMLDGHPMARRGEGETALACAAGASALGSCLGIVCLIAALPFVRPIVLAFGPIELLVIALWGLTTLILVVGPSPRRGLIMAGLGIAAGLVGLDPRSAEPRWTFGSLMLADGLPVVPVLLGLFALAEGIRLLGAPREAASQARIELRGSRRDGLLAIWRNRWLFLRSSIIGTTVGMVPGIGGTVASFVAYAHASQSARPPARFGEGDVRGVLAPEAAHDAKDGGSLLPVLTFGLPGSEGTVLLLAAFTLHGIVPGPRLFETDLALVFALIWSLFLSNWLTSILGLLATPRLAGIGLLAPRTLAPIVLGLAFTAALAYRGQPGDLWVAVAFGIAGFALGRFGWPRVPFVIAFLLAPIIEDNALLAWRLVEIGRIAPLERPVVYVLVALLAATSLWGIRAKRRSRAAGLGR